MTAEHNHAPRCCCPTYQVAPDDHDYEPKGGRIEREVCPACPEHGQLAPGLLAGHHLVHSEAFIDQGDPRGWRNAIDPNKP